MTIEKTKTLITADELLDLPDDGRKYELTNGELVEMTPPGGEHGELQIGLGSILRPFVRERGLGRVLGEVGVQLTLDPDTVRAPDICFVAADKLPDGKAPIGYLETVPDLIIEIVSPNDRASEVQEKVQEWLNAGARAVWVLYPRTRAVVIHSGAGDGRTFGPGETLTGDPVLPGFSCPVDQIFEE